MQGCESLQGTIYIVIHTFAVIFITARSASLPRLASALRFFLYAFVGRILVRVRIDGEPAEEE